MRTATLVVVTLALRALAPTLPAKEVAWRIAPTKKTKLVFEEGVKKFNWPWSRNDPSTIAPFAAEEKRWMKAVFPKAEFRLLKNGDSGFPDEYLVLPDRRVLAKDDFFPVPAGGDGAQALVFLVRPADGLVSADGKPEVNAAVPAAPPAPVPPSPEPARKELDLDALLYMDDPPTPEDLDSAVKVEEPTPPPPPPPVVRERVDRSRIAGEIRFIVVKAGPSGAVKMLYRSQPIGPFPGVDVTRIRSFALGRGRGFGIVYEWDGDTPETVHVGYHLFSRGPWGITQAWTARVLNWVAEPLDRFATRFHFSDVNAAQGGTGEPELFVRRVNLSTMMEVPSARSFLPVVGGAVSADGARGVVDIFQLRGGIYKMTGRADRAKGDRPVALRKNWPDYIARSSRGPSLLLSFGNPGSPYQAYPCPWPGHPANKVPWVGKDYLFKGGRYRKGEKDLGLAAWFVHDPQALYLVAVVRDDKLVLPSIDKDPALGDHLQLWLDPVYGNESIMLEIFPGSPPGAGAYARVRSPSSKVGPATRIRVAARPFETGYWLEAAIPYSYLEEVGLRPGGSLWGFVVNAVDVDGAPGSKEKTVLSTSKNYKWAKTSTFNNLILE